MAVGDNVNYENRSEWVVVAGERLDLLPERAIFWPRARTLFIADAHWGKASSFRAQGVFVPRGTTLDGITRADAIIERTGAQRIVFLGDFLHARTGRTPGTLNQLEAWRERHASLDMLLVRGNHDRRAGDPPDALRIDCVEEPVLEPPFALAHYPNPCEGAYVLAGHLHPAARLVGRGRQRVRLACYWFGARIGVLPAFGDFTGYATIQPASQDRIYVIADGGVIDVSGAGS